MGKIIILLLSITTLFGACTKEEYYDSTDIYQQYPIIEAQDWEWNPDLNRYEAVKNLNGFNSNLYNDASITVSAFWDEGTLEIQTSLPYVRTWIDANDVKYDETVSYELIKNTSSIIFYIQNSDWEARPSSKIRYQFKFSAIKYLD